MGNLTDKERAFLIEANMDAATIAAMDEGRMVTATGPAFMSWLRLAFGKGMLHERGKRPKRRRVRLYGRRRRIRLRSGKA